MAPLGTPAEHAILGLLALEESAGHGYDLARQFADDRPLGTVLHLEPGMLYHHLKKLAKAGWVSSREEPQPSRPARQVYAITAAGRAELDRWLREPVAHTREIRLEFLVKLWFARRIDPALGAQLIAQQRAMLERLAGQLAQRIPDPALDAADRDFLQAVTDLRLAQTRAALAWLESV